MPDASMASETADRNAMLDTVAPDTVSTLSVWCSTMRSLRMSMPAVPTPYDSRDFSRLMRAMASPSVMTSTVSSPPLPLDVPVHACAPSPVTPDAAEAASPFGAQPASASVPPSAAMAPPVMKFLRERLDMVPSLVAVMQCSAEVPSSASRCYDEGEPARITAEV